MDINDRKLLQNNFVSTNKHLACIPHITYLWLFKKHSALSAGIEEYTDGTSAEG